MERSALVIQTGVTLCFAGNAAHKHLMIHASAQSAGKKVELIPTSKEFILTVCIRVYGGHYFG
jgi:hypothetical protein